MTTLANDDLWNWPAVMARTSALIAEGRMVEAGWVNLAVTVCSPGTDPRITAALRHAFMAGADHMRRIMADARPGDDATINAEMAAFHAARTEGRADGE